MKPWDIIGWGLIAVIGFAALFTVAIALIAFLGGWWLHLTTRNTKPEVGQAWTIGGRTYEIVRAEAHGVRIRWSASFGSFEAWDSPDEWRLRLRQGCGFLTA